MRSMNLNKIENWNSNISFITRIPYIRAFLTYDLSATLINTPAHRTIRRWHSSHDFNWNSKTSKASILHNDWSIHSCSSSNNTQYPCIRSACLRSQTATAIQLEFQSVWHATHSHASTHTVANSNSIRSFSLIFISRFGQKLNKQVSIVHLFPSRSLSSYMRWTRITIIYEHMHGRMCVATSSSMTKAWPVSVYDEFSFRSPRCLRVYACVWVFTFWYFFCAICLNSTLTSLCFLQSTRVIQSVRNANKTIRRIRRRRRRHRLQRTKIVFARCANDSLFSIMRSLAFNSRGK